MARSQRLFRPAGATSETDWLGADSASGFSPLAADHPLPTFSPPSPLLPADAEEAAKEKADEPSAASTDTVEAAPSTRQEPLLGQAWSPSLLHRAVVQKKLHADQAGAEEEEAVEAEADGQDTDPQQDQDEDQEPDENEGAEDMSWGTDGEQTSADEEGAEEVEEAAAAEEEVAATAEDVEDAEQDADDDGEEEEEEQEEEDEQEQEQKQEQEQQEQQEQEVRKVDASGGPGARQRARGTS